MRLPSRLLLLPVSLLSALAPGVAAGDGADPAPAAEQLERLTRLNNLGIAHLARFRESEAIEAFTAALKIDAGYAPAHTNLGIAYLSLAEYERAVASLTRASELAPGEPHILFNLGLVFKIQGNTEKAIEAFEAVRAADPDDPDTLYQLATLYARERRFDAAIPAFQRSIELGPGNVSAYYGLGKALLQSGDAEQGRRYLERSQEMKAQSDLHTTVGTRYGEQGKYSYAVEDHRVRELARGPAPPPIPVRFVEVPARETGLRRPGAEIADGCGEGAALADVDGDGDLDLYVTGCRSGRLFRNEGSLRFVDVTEAAGLADGFPGRAASFGDYDNDRRPDLYVGGPEGERLYRNGEGDRFSDVSAAAAVDGAGARAGAAWADVDHDGDLDLYVVRRATGGGPPNRLLRNDGDGTFTEQAAAMGLQGKPGGGPSVLFSDLDNDRDIDLVLPGRAWLLMSNDRVGTFTDVAAARGLTGPPSHGVAAGDFDKDGLMDLAATGPSGLLLYRNASGARFTEMGRVAELTSRLAPGGTVPYGVAFLDFDNDGFLDLAAASGASRGPAVWLLRNAGAGEVEDGTARTGLDRIRARGGRSLLAADLDGDGDVELLLTRAGGDLTLLRNDGGSRNGSLTVDVVGRGSNRDGVGAKVEVKAGRLWQKTEVATASGYLSSGPTRLHLGLGDAGRADTLRLLWPSGVLQDEIDLAAGEPVELEELDRKGSSCPILYAWNGSAFGFVTDFLGGAAVGYRLGPHRFNTPDTDEYVRLRGDQLRARDGLLELRMVNQLEEVIFFDAASLLAVDHPSGQAVYPHERLLPGPPFPDFRLFPVGRERPPVSAVNGRGEDVLDRVLEEDRIWPDAFRLLPFKGYAEEHAIILDPGDLGDAARVVLLADAWIDYADSTSNLAASQAGIELLPPRLEVRDGKGGWVTALPQMGFPAGLPKTLTVELSGLFRSREDLRIRIVTSMRIYWDRLRFGILEEGEPRITRLEASAAELRFKGYPRPVSPDGRIPFGYDYADAATTSSWKDFGGSFTGYGEVRELLRAADDRYVITRHGDEVALSFDAAALPPLPDGWSRTWLLFSDGFGKDMDLNSAAPDRVEPLPFHGMSRYPPPAGEFIEAYASRLEWILRHNRRRRDRALPPLP